MNLRALWLIAPVLAALAGSASGANLALSSANPYVTLTGYKYPGTPLTGEVNDGNLAAVGVYMGTTWQNSMGYNLGVTGLLESVVIRQDTQGGVRKRLLDVAVYTGGGVYTFTGLPDQNVITLTLPNAIATSWVTVMPLAKQPTGTDHNLGIIEIEAHGELPSGLSYAGAARTNLAAGIVPTLTGGWNSGTASLLTDGNIYSSAYHKNPGGYAQFDLGAAQTVGGFGIAQNMMTGTREVWKNVQLDFSDAADFSALVGTRTGTLYNRLAYQAFDFDPITARYVRIIDSGRLFPSGTEWDANTQIFELQLLSPLLPEPAALALLALLGGLVTGTVRPRRTP
jgi:hypothetical protein